MGQIFYHAIVLKDNSQLKALLAGNPEIADWDVIAHHVTVDSGPAKNHLIPYIGKDFTIIATHIGTLDNKVIAVKVKVPMFEKIHSFNRTPHITLAVNRSVGAKPVQSNDIKKWVPLNKQINLQGTLWNLDGRSKIVK